MTHTVSTLANKAMLVRLKRTMWQPYKFDAVATVAAEHACGVQNAGRFNKRLMKDSKALRAALSAYTTVYQYVMRNTLPWLDDGLRLLRADTYLEFAQDLRHLIAEADKAVAELAAVWPAEVAADMQRLGTLANKSDYPNDIAAEFSISVRFLPVPTSGDFRVDVSAEDRASLEEEIREAERKAAKHVVEELIAPLATLAKRLSEYTGEAGQRFHASIVENVLEAASRLERINLSDDPTVLDAIGQVKKFAQAAVFNVAAIKDNPAVREDVKSAAERLVSTFSGIV